MAMQDRASAWKDPQPPFRLATRDPRAEQDGVTPNLNQITMRLSQPSPHELSRPPLLALKLHPLNGTTWVGVNKGLTVTARF